MERGDEEQDQLCLRHLGHQDGEGDGGSVERAEAEFDSCGSRAAPRKCESQVGALLYQMLVWNVHFVSSAIFKAFYLKLVFHVQFSDFGLVENLRQG